MENMKDVSLLEEQLQKAEMENEVAVNLFENYIQSAVLTEEEIESGRFAELEKNYNKSLEKVEILRNQIADRTRRTLAISRFIDEINSFEHLIDEFTEELWTGLCDRITIHEKGIADVRFKSGLEIEVKI